MQLPKDLLSEILQYTVEEKYVFQNWVDEKKINNTKLCLNPRAVDFLADNPNKITRSLSCNTNPEAIKILAQYPDKIDWKLLSRNPNPEAIKLLKDNRDKIDYDSLLLNHNPEAIEIIVNRIGYINVEYLLDGGWEDIHDMDWDILLLDPNPDDIKACKEKIAELKAQYIPYHERAPDVHEITNTYEFKMDDAFWHAISSEPGIFKNSRKETIERLLRNM